MFWFWWWLTSGQSIGELVKEFFNYFAFQWHFKNNVVSIRSPTGLLTKESKGWTTLAESTGPQSQTIKSRYLIAIEDPFEITHNVARTVNKQGRLDIRGEFMRAAKMLNSPFMRRQFLGDVCVERVLPERPVSQTEKPGENGEKEGVQKENEGAGK
jgi:terminal uridylyltransferase